MAKNLHKVPKKQWAKWPELAQITFNETYESLLHNQKLFLHPKQDPARQEYWGTTCWNAAWVAADAALKALKHIAEGTE
jgi:hypothetical protein